MKNLIMESAGCFIFGAFFFAPAKSSNLASVVERRFQTASEANRLQTLWTRSRSDYDRNGLVLAENRPNLQLLVVLKFDDLMWLLLKCVRVLIFRWRCGAFAKILNLGGDP